MRCRKEPASCKAKSPRQSFAARMRRKQVRSETSEDLCLGCFSAQTLECARVRECARKSASPRKNACIFEKRVEVFRHAERPGPIESRALSFRCESRAEFRHMASPVRPPPVHSRSTPCSMPLSRPDQRGAPVRWHPAQIPALRAPAPTWERPRPACSAYTASPATGPWR